MSKKWLYSVAAAALLIAGQAAGITVHDVLSNGFWSTEIRQTEETLNAATTDNYKEKYKEKAREINDIGLEIKSYVYTKKAKTTNDVSWTQNTLHRFVDEENVKIYEDNQVIRVKNYDRKERIKERNSVSTDYVEDCPLIIYGLEQAQHSFKPTKKGARPVEPFFPDTEWFRQLSEEKYPGFCYSTSILNAETNIISDSKAQIKGVIRKTSLLYLSENGSPLADPEQDPNHETFEGYALYPYEKTITIIDDKYLRIEQQIAEDSMFEYSTTGRYSSVYVANFNKKGDWKNSKEKVVKRRISNANSWYTNYYQKNKERE